MGKVIAVTSFKGGVGKSTVAVNIAKKLSLTGHRTLICDLDTSAGSVALLLGAGEDTIYNLYDFLNTGEKKAEMKPGQSKADLYFMTSPFFAENYSITDDSFEKFLEWVRNDYDYIIFDCPPGRFVFFDVLTKNADIVYVVTLHIKTSVKATERMKYLFAENNVKNPRLIINCFNSQGILEGTHPGIVEMIETFKIKLAGIIEYDESISHFAEVGATVYDNKNKKAAKYFDDITSRLLGRNISLNKKYDGKKTEKLYFKKK